VQVGGLPKLALGLNGGGGRARVQSQLDSAERRIDTTARSLDRLAGNRSDSLLIIQEAHPMFILLERANDLASSGQLRLATVGLGAALLPGAPGYELNETFATIAAKYGNEASSARKLADFGSVTAIVLLLLAVSIVIWRASELGRENHLLLEQSRHDALTDELTGLANRRKLFADLDHLLTRRTSMDSAMLGVLDLDGFKAYNDSFGHPAGDTLLARMGQALRSAVKNDAVAYRIGGDEFCVIAHGSSAAAILENARSILAEHMGGRSIGCSLGSALIDTDASTADELLRQADQRLYENKRSSRSRRPLPNPGAGRQVVAT
jgi:diguanylate cyclase (GGDEF)-like protein